LGEIELAQPGARSASPSGRRRSGEVAGPRRGRQPAKEKRKKKEEEKEEEKKNRKVFLNFVSETRNNTFFFLFLVFVSDVFLGTKK